MPKYKIKGVLVKFPFDIYPIQLRYMEKVINTLKKKKSYAVLESPTGTGKTLSLLCSIFAYIEKEENRQYEQMFGRNPVNFVTLLNRVNKFQIIRNIPQVIYLTRTHSQISQAIKELRRSGYRAQVGLVGSRDQMCINEKLKDLSNEDKVLHCQAERAEGKCKYYRGTPHSIYDSYPLETGPIMDIEDIVKLGKKHEFCPYYASKETVSDADIIFMPYNYILDLKVRHITKIELSNKIVVFDEAHNVEKMCEDSADASITSEQIGRAIRDMRYIINEELDFSYTLDGMLNLISSMKKMKRKILNIDIERANEAISKSGDYVFRMLNKCGINETNHESILELLYKLRQILVKESRANEADTRRRYRGKVKKPKRRRCPTGIGLRAVASFLRVVFSSSAPDLRKRVNKCYKIYAESLGDRSNNGECPKKLNFWCFSPAFGMQYLRSQGIRNLILTSGTLTPLKPMISELKLPNPVQLTNPHVIDDFQIFVRIVGSGPDETTLDSRFRNRENEDYLRSLGLTILEFSKVIPDGLLVFFPSYLLMEKCVEFWKENENIWSSIEDVKKIFTESKVKSEFQASMEGYYATIDSPKSSGAIFMAVMRGKVSEGLDFSDRYGRGVIITGLPLVKYDDPKIVLKREYLDENRTQENQLPTGQEWYDLNAIRVVNQAIGRIIRHRNDHGAILLCDNRFHDECYKQNLSGWIQQHLNNQNDHQEFDPIINDLKQFYSTIEERLPQRPIRQINDNTSSSDTTSEVESVSDDPPQVRIHQRRRLKRQRIGG